MPALVGLVPLAVWVARLPAAHAGVAARGGALFGVIHHAVLLHWIVPALGWATALAVPAFLAVLAVLVALTGGLGWALHRAVHGAGAPLALALPVAWVAMEWTRAHLPGGLAFPWLELGVALAGFPRIAGVAEVVGTRGLSFWLAGVNGLLASALLVRGAGRIRFAAGAALLFVVPAGWGIWRAEALETRPAARVALVQPDLPAGSWVDRRAALARAMDAIEELLPALEPGRVDLVVLPEGTIPYDLEAPEARDARALLAREARRLGVPVAVGTYGSGGAGDESAPGRALRGAGPRAPADEPVAWRNSVAVVGRDARLVARYDKRRLVPLVERAALAFGGADPSTPPIVEVRDTSFGVLLCWEAIFDEEGRRRRAGGAEVLLNPTNDVWYGDPSGGGRTVALRQHPAHLVLRAIETRAGAVRAANTGVSFVVDPLGRILTELPLGRRALRVVEVPTSDVTSAFVRSGDVTGKASVTLLLLVLLAARLRPTGPFRAALPRLDRSARRP